MGLNATDLSSLPPSPFLDEPRFLGSYAGNRCRFAEGEDVCFWSLLIDELLVAPLLVERLIHRLTLRMLLMPDCLL